MTILNLFKYVKDVTTFPAGQVIFKENEVGELAYVVLDGEVEISYKGKSVEQVGPGGLIGEMALIDHKVRSATATATTDVKLAPIDRKHFIFMVDETPYFALEVMQIMGDRLRRRMEGLG